MSELHLALGAIVVAVALAVVALAIWVQAAPNRDRTWRDRMPGWWRWTAWLAHPLAHTVAPALPAVVERNLATMLKRAGLAFALEPQDLCAGALMAGAAGAALGALAGAAITAPASGALLGAAIGMLWTVGWVKDLAARRLRAIDRALPFYLDLVTLTVESGANLTGALAQAVDSGPPGPLKDELARVLGDLRAGRTRADALRAMAERIASAAVSSWVAALVAADRNGSGLGQVLRAQAEQRRQERFQRAEKLAMQAPVKMLFPLLAFIFPCTFVLLFFPIVVRLLQEGMLS
jgi:tight adherence protein C